MFCVKRASNLDGRHQQKFKGKLFQSPYRVMNSDVLKRMRSVSAKRKLQSVRGEYVGEYRDITSIILLLGEGYTVMKCFE